MEHRDRRNDAQAEPQTQSGNGKIPRRHRQDLQLIVFAPLAEKEIAPGKSQRQLEVIFLDQSITDCSLLTNFKRQVIKYVAVIAAITQCKTKFADLAAVYTQV